MWLPHPEDNCDGKSNNGQLEHLEEDEEREGEGTRHTIHPGVLRDNHRCYFGPAEKVDEILRVGAYHKRWPQIPLDDLHAPSVQLPRF